jgi:hypothetical protein
LLEEKKRNDWSAFFLGPDKLCWLCHVCFPWMLVAIKGWLKGQSLSFMCT